MTKLKPCPFCTGDAALLTTIHKKYFVECVKCGVGFDQHYLWSETKEQAIAKWNARKRWSLLSIFKRLTKRG